MCDLTLGINECTQVIGNTSDPTAATTEQFAEFWGELAGRFRTNPNVVFGINNEPHDMVSELVWFSMPQINTAYMLAYTIDIEKQPGRIIQLLVHVYISTFNCLVSRLQSMQFAWLAHHN